MRLIVADELKKVVERELAYDGYGIRRFNEIIDNVPTVEFPNYSGKVVPDALQGWRYEEKGRAI